jgi:glyoxylase I family protein
MSPREPLAKRRPSPPEILGVDHIYLSVSKFARSRIFYDRLMKSLGFKKGTFPVGAEPHCHYYNRSLQITIRPARNRESKHDSYSPGLHHLCLRVESSDAVEKVAGRLRAMGIEIEGPRLWPEYAPDYYAVFFSDPDGIRFEVMNHMKRRKIVRKLWTELEGFTNPLDRLMRRRADQSRKPF